jgi:hypothetical protein
VSFLAPSTSTARRPCRKPHAPTATICFRHRRDGEQHEHWEPLVDAAAEGARVRLAELHGVARRRRWEMVRRRDAVGVHALLTVAVLLGGCVLLPAVESKLPLLHGGGGGGAVEGVTGRDRRGGGRNPKREKRSNTAASLESSSLAAANDDDDLKDMNAYLGRRKLPLHRCRRASSSSEVICITRNYEFTHKSRRTEKKNNLKSISSQIHSCTHPSLLWQITCPKSELAHTPA